MREEAPRHSCCEETVPLLVWSSPVQVEGLGRLEPVENCQCSKRPKCFSSTRMDCSCGGTDELIPGADEWKCRIKDVWGGRRIKWAKLEEKKQTNKQTEKKKLDKISLYSEKTTFTAFTETLRQHQNFLREVGGGAILLGEGWVRVAATGLTNFTGMGGGGLKLGQGRFKTTLLTVKERKKIIC